MIYLDNAATSFPKPECVYTEVGKCMREYCANPGRSGHRMALAAGRALLKAREAVAQLFNLQNPMEICFMPNATYAINAGLKGILRPGQHVITTSMEHNSVIRPLMEMQRSGLIELTLIQCDRCGNMDPQDIRRVAKSNTRLFVCTLSSNVNGCVMPVYEISNICTEMGIPFMLDASQGAGCIPLDVQRLNLSMMAFPGHKGLMGPQGTGGLYVNERIELNSIVEGGTGSNSENVYQPRIMPDRLESGTLNLPGLAGLTQGLEYIMQFGEARLHQYKCTLVRTLLDGFSQIPGVKIYSSIDPDANSGIAAINIKDEDSSEIAYLLDKKFNICVRAGLHCAPMAHRTLGTHQTGIVRFSPGVFNTMAEMEQVLDAVERIARCR